MKETFIATFTLWMLPPSHRSVNNKHCNFLIIKKKLCDDKIYIIFNPWLYGSALSLICIISIYI